VNRSIGTTAARYSETFAALVAGNGAKARQLTVTQITASIEWLIEAQSLLEQKDVPTMVSAGRNEPGTSARITSITAVFDPVFIRPAGWAELVERYAACPGSVADHTELDHLVCAA